MSTEQGIRNLMRCYRREVYGSEMRQLLTEAVEQLQEEGAVGSRALAELIRDLLNCRSREIVSALSIAKDLEPTSELISAVRAVESASQIIQGTRGSFDPEIVGENQIGWTDFTHNRATNQAKQALEALSSKLK
ncbi:MAG: hypothetical protein GTO45_26420 [Candidatus Aminicenantes bacterium]|nr:hypothetical protein [Candidatus Aminicenantes bacterium]NIM82410.1 hypothetical protein [Candidatus Aminicenantes bacterium]NIN21958.1 hypothetical protein [Candidatus Aminicenantes bacterium]NIN45474.1 hypothetical protein [Candidatus Aminicenantes bacterium]NIN88305.1 hypothetical protein [Candidatus Aminicenantes bacterium]